MKRILALALLLTVPGLLGSCSTKQVEQETLANPNDADAWERLGNAYRMRFQKRRAADAYREALRLDPERTHLASRMPNSQSRESRDLRRQAMASPNDDEVWGDLGDLLRYEGDLLGARQAYMRAFRIDPADSEWHGALIELGAVEQLLEYAEATLDQSDDEALGDLGDLLSAAGRQEEACDHWRRAAEIDPSDEEWLNHATDCGFPLPEGYHPDYGFDTGHHGAPRVPTRPAGLPDADDIPGLLERRNADAGLLIRLGQAYLMAGQRKEAEETLWGALLVNPTDEEALQSYLVAAQRTRRQVLEELRQRFPENDEVVGTLADHYLDLGMRDRAGDLYDLAHRLDEADPEWKAKRQLLGR